MSKRALFYDDGITSAMCSYDATDDQQQLVRQLVAAHNAGAGAEHVIIGDAQLLDRLDPLLRSAVPHRSVQYVLEQLQPPPE